MSFAMMMMTAAFFPAAAFHSAPLKSMQQRRTMRCYKHRTPVLSHTKLQLSNYIEDAVDEEVFMTKSPLTDDDIESIANNNNNIIIDDSRDSIEESINKQAGLLSNINSERTLGILVLLTVPLAWGTYSPVVKYMYDKMNPSMPGFVFSGKSAFVHKAFIDCSCIFNTNICYNHLSFIFTNNGNGIFQLDIT